MGSQRVTHDRETELNWIDHKPICLFLGSPVLGSMCLFLCQYYTDWITVVFCSSPKSGNPIPPVLVFFLKIDLAIQGLSSFHTKFKMVCFSSVENALVFNPHWICGLPLIAWLFKEYQFFQSTNKVDLSLCLYYLQCLWSGSYSFSVQVFHHHLGTFIPRCFISLSFYSFSLTLVAF